MGGSVNQDPFFIKFRFFTKKIIQSKAIRLIITPTLFPIVSKPVPINTKSINKILVNIFIIIQLLYMV